MKLYYSPGACSLAPHIILKETMNNFDLIKVDLESKVTDNGEDFTNINPHGYVPVLQLDNDDILTEGVVIMQYLADQSPEYELAPENGTFERTRLQERLNYLASELHKSFSPLFSEAPDSEKQKAISHINSILQYIDTLLTNKTYLIGDKFTIADAYLFVLLSWTKPTGINLDHFPNIMEYFITLSNRESVINAMKLEGLLN